MFKNRSFNVKMVKDENPVQPNENFRHNVYALEAAVRDNVKPIALAVSYMIGAKTLSEIALHIAKTKIK